MCLPINIVDSSHLINEYKDATIMTGDNVYNISDIYSTNIHI